MFSLLCHLYVAQDLKKETLALFLVNPVLKWSANLVPNPVVERLVEVVNLDLGRVLGC